MKKIFILLAVAFLAVSANKVSAQSFKFGYINTQELMPLVPDVDSVQKKLQAYGKELEAVIEDAQVEYNKKLDVYQKGSDKMSDVMKASKQKELNEIRTRIEEQMSSAQQDYNKEEQKLMTPVLEKIKNAINKVGKDNGFTYIFNSSTGVLPYMDETQCINTLSLVKKELKITK